MSALSGRVSHVLVVFDGTESSRRALLDGRAIADEHAAELSVVTLVAHERRRVAAACPRRTGTV
jgi:nucleotide-binding universal stress UspA family protein